jgi:hypothetical protein
LASAVFSSVPPGAADAGASVCPEVTKLAKIIAIRMPMLGIRIMELVKQQELCQGVFIARLSDMRSPLFASAVP